MSPSIRLFIVLLVVVPVLTGTIVSQDRFRWDAGAVVGATLPVAEGDDDHISNGVRGFLRYAPLEFAAFEFGVGYLAYRDLQSAPSNLDIEGYVVPIGFRAAVSTSRYSRIVPYVMIGGGLSFYRGDTGRGDGEAGAPGPDYSGEYLHATFGLGATLRLSGRVALELQVGNNVGADDGLHPTIDDQGDGIWFGMAGLSIGIGPSDVKVQNPVYDEMSAWDELSAEKDSDGDGLSDREEFGLYGSFLDTDDSDSDGLTDYVEVKETGTDPLIPDTDSDGLLDGEEVRTHNTDPLNPDTDGDSISDGQEVEVYLTDPLSVDSDGDVLSDYEELTQYGTNPLKVDTDSDGITDGAEVRTWNTDPLNPDTDGDGLADGEEVTDFGSDPAVSDSDGGGVPDGLEVERGTNPTDPDDDR